MRLANLTSGIRSIGPLAPALGRALGVAVGAAVCVAVIAVYPVAALVVGAALAGAALVARSPVATRGLGMGAGTGALALAAAVRPALSGAAGGTAVIGAALARQRRAGLAAASREVRLILAAVGLAALATFAAVWPTAFVLLLLCATTLAIAVRSPPAGFLVAVAAFGFEGTLKALLTSELPSLFVEPRAVVALTLDVALVAVIALVVLRERPGRLRLVWVRASRLERAAMAMLVAWIPISLAQVPESGDLVQALAGVRLTHVYLLAGVAAILVFWPSDRTDRRVMIFLALLAGISAYAALRVATGPLPAERSYASLHVSNVTLGGVFRAVGSFSGVFGLASFLTPVAAFGLVAGLAIQRLRVLAWTTATCALVAIVASFVRAPLVAVGLTLALAGGFALIAGASPWRRRATVVLAATGLLVVGGGATVAASTASPRIEERTRGILDPFGDESMRLRFERWKDAARIGTDHPLGLGMGTLGRAAGVHGGPRETDSSLLKVAVEQGIFVATALLAALAALPALLAWRLRRLPAARRALAGSALAGFVAYLLLLPFGIYIEQPGKVVAWSLLGMALAQIYGSPPVASPGSARGRK